MDEFAVNAIDVKPKLFIDVLLINPLELMNPLELLIYFIFWELLFNSPFIFFKLLSVDDINRINSGSYATGLA